MDLLIIPRSFEMATDVRGLHDDDEQLSFQQNVNFCLDLQNY